MKQLIFLLLFTTLRNYSYGQDSSIALSRFEIFTGQSNKIMKTEYSEIGYIGWRRIYKIKTTDLLSQDSSTAVWLGFRNPGDMSNFVDPASFYIDNQELDSVIKVLDRFVQEAETSKPTTSLKFYYTTSNDIIFLATYDFNNGLWQYEMAKVYKNLRAIVPSTLTTLNRRRFNQLVELLREAKFVKL